MATEVPQCPTQEWPEMGRTVRCNEQGKQAIHEMEYGQMPTPPHGQTGAPDAADYMYRKFAGRNMPARLKPLTTAHGKTFKTLTNFCKVYAQRLEQLALLPFFPSGCSFFISTLSFSRYISNSANMPTNPMHLALHFGLTQRFCQVVTRVYLACYLHD